MRFRNLITCISIVFISAACQQAGNTQLAAINETVKAVGKNLVPDGRIDIFKVEAVERDGKMTLSGDVLNPLVSAMLQDSLKTYFPDIEFANQIQVLPSDSLGDKTFGIVNISVANIRRYPKFQAELVNQTILGTMVRLLKAKRGFYYVQNRDQYLGWLHKNSVVAVTAEELAEWQNSEQMICISNYGVVHSAMTGANKQMLVDLVPGAILKKSGDAGNYVKVEMPDQKIGYVEKSVMISKENLDKVQATREKIITTSKQFLGVPYLWGGTSSKGFDCSGFVQTVFRLNNMELPRDASQIVREGEEIATGEKFENLVVGDLLFFGDKPGRISHVAIYMGDHLYIHSSTSVHINSLDPEHPLFSEYRHRTFQKAKRLL